MKHEPISQRYPIQRFTECPINPDKAAKPRFLVEAPLADTEPGGSFLGGDQLHGSIVDPVGLAITGSIGNNADGSGVSGSSIGSLANTGEGVWIYYTVVVFLLGIGGYFARRSQWA